MGDPETDRRCLDRIEDFGVDLAIDQQQRRRGILGAKVFSSQVDDLGSRTSIVEEVVKVNFAAQFKGKSKQWERLWHFLSLLRRLRCFHSGVETEKILC